ncbi:2-isopropylmalate synthase [Rhizomicrobium palustre]|uniref:2-isopropylmalate synthase n=1 Tax=Rhizomicrobium palustre TaxID=189966 RepID=A0A846MW44_9PROT|nr:2-isopropylmalate synthase [Rhizomicrobium palustre]NIK87445.1 2-isopropylmalate synthase [Rhizomicrobium palustre]
MTTNNAGQNNRVRIFDTTLRDGEQSPGAAMTFEEKLEVADLLDNLGVDVIEAGFPIASVGDFEAVSEIARRVKNASVCGLARAGFKDIDRAGEAVRNAKRPRIHTFISTSPVHMKHKLNMGANAVLDAVGASVSHARNLVEEVQWSAEDATRTEHDFLCRCVELAIRSGATTINIPDTVGYATPQEFFELIAMLFNRVPNIDKAVIATHCHNDLGLAVANSLAGVLAGARQVECTINGIGERAGNAALEEIVMALRVRRDRMPFETGIDAKLLSKASKLVSNVTGFPVQYNKAIVGKNAFSHESGIHQDGMLKNVETYEIIRPEDVGVSATSLILGKLSGRHAFKDKLSQLGYELADAAFEDAFRRFKALADKKKSVFDDDIVALVDDEIIRAQDIIVVKSLKVMTGVGIPPSAEMTLIVEGEEKKAEVTGDGAVDAIFNVIRELYPHSVNLQLYQVKAVTEGTDAQAHVSVRLEEDGRTVTGRGADTDTLVASAYAYVNALNKLLVKRRKQAPEALNVAK